MGWPPMWQQLKHVFHNLLKKKKTKSSLLAAMPRYPWVPGANVIKWGENCRKEKEMCFAATQWRIKELQHATDTLKTSPVNNASDICCLRCSDLQMKLITVAFSFHKQTTSACSASINKEEEKKQLVLLWRHLISNNYGLGTSWYDYFYSGLFCMCYISNHRRAKPGGRLSDVAYYRDLDGISAHLIRKNVSD